MEVNETLAIISLVVMILGSFALGYMTGRIDEKSKRNRRDKNPYY